MTNEPDLHPKIMMGMPVNINELLDEHQPDHGLERWEPGPGYKMFMCESHACGKDMWLGPNQQATLDAFPDTFVLLCMPCGIKIMESYGGANVYELGGR